MKAGIVIEDWKLSIFERHPKQAGYSFTNAGGLMPGTILLTVEFSDSNVLQHVVRAAQLEAQKAKGPNQ